MKAINLIPPEAAIRSADRRRRFGIVMLAVMYVALLGIGYMFFQGREGELQDRLSEQEMINQRLQADIAALAPARQLEADLRSGADQVTH